MPRLDFIVSYLTRRRPIPPPPSFVVAAASFRRMTTTTTMMMMIRIPLFESSSCTTTISRRSHPHHGLGSRILSRSTTTCGGSTSTTTRPCRRQFGSTTTTSVEDDSKIANEETTTLGAGAGAKDPHNITMEVVHPKEEPHHPVEEEKVQEEPLSAEHRNQYYTVPVIIQMPDMSEGNDNTVETWYKQPGDVVKYNDILCDIATQDFTFGLSIDDEHDALMGDIHVEAGSQAPDGAPICTIYHPNEEEQENAK